MPLSEFNRWAGLKMVHLGVRIIQEKRERRNEENAMKMES
jgi:hypothetical protein